MINKEKFYILRNELVKNSCNEIKEKSNRYKRYISKYPNDKDFLLNPSIRESILEDLSNRNWDAFDLGSQYIATLATMYYHERELFKRKDNKEYFDLSIYDNEHLKMLGTTPYKARIAMNKAIYKYEGSYLPIDEIVYELADEYIAISNTKKRKKYYSKTLLK